MRIFKTKIFSKWSKKVKISDEALIKAIEEIENGLTDANLGNNIYKKRVATQGRGKRGSTRTLLAYKKNSKAFFIYGFEKNVRSSITENEKNQLKLIGEELLKFTKKEIDKKLEKGSLIELKEKQNG